jgi:hypothetical protein
MYAALTGFMSLYRFFLISRQQYFADGPSTTSSEGNID